MGAPQLAGPITVGTLVSPVAARPVHLESVGYIEEEYFVSGEATAYQAVGVLPEDGHWEVEPASVSPYATRILVRRPADPTRFDGTVLVEWMNVTVMETAPEWTQASRSMVAAGAAWVGVSIQAISVEGGRPAIQTGDPHQESDGLRHHEPERYGPLQHPGDQYSYDMFSQVAAVLRSPAGAAIFGPVRPLRILAMGQSQSAAFLTTYINALEVLTQAYDGFLVHSRGFNSAGLDGFRSRDVGFPVQFRTDLRTPILVFETETDVGPVFRYAQARQADTDFIRVWEAAGTAHADAYLVGRDFGLCGQRVNAGPQHYVVNAALGALIRWAEEGVAPPHADRLQTTGPTETTIVRDEHGIALGGIRTPLVDVPVATLSGDPPEGADVLCVLFGSTTPFPSETLTTLYPTRGAYVDAFEQSLDAAIAAGFVRAEDRADFLAEADLVEL